MFWWLVQNIINITSVIHICCKICIYFEIVRKNNKEEIAIIIINIIILLHIITTDINSTINRVKKFTRNVFICVFIVLPDDMVPGSCSWVLQQRFFCPKIHFVFIFGPFSIFLATLLPRYHYYWDLTWTVTLPPASRMSWWRIQEHLTRWALDWRLGPGSDSQDVFWSQGDQFSDHRAALAIVPTNAINVWKSGY